MSLASEVRRLSPASQRRGIDNTPIVVQAREWLAGWLAGLVDEPVRPARATINELGATRTASEYIAARTTECVL